MSVENAVELPEKPGSGGRKRFPVSDDEKLERKREKQRAYYQANKERIKKEVAAWQKANPEKFREYNKKTRVAAYQDETKALAMLARNRKKRVRWRQEAMELLGGAFCNRCGFDDMRALQIDHINGGGNKHIREVGGNGLVHAVRRNPEGYQVLCANCNWIKRCENGEHPSMRVPSRGRLD